MRKVRILTNDPSMTAWGWAVLDETGKIYEAGCIKTEPKHKKLNIRKGDDTVRRLSEINQELLRVIHEHGICYLVSELPHGSQSASAAVMIGAVTGLLQAMADTLDVGLEWYSEADAKKATLGKISATKIEMMTAINKYHSDVPWTGIGYKDEAVADALGVFRAAIKVSPMFKLFSKT